MKKLWTLVIISVLVLGLAGCGAAGNKNVKISIVQIEEHPALDDARLGFLETLKANGYEEGKNLRVDYKNAQGDQAALYSIVQKFAADNPNLVLAIATSSAQAMAAASKDIPILITAVTDPVEAKLVNSLAKPGTNVTGTTDMNPLRQQFELLKALIPTAKKVGIIYNAGEVNSLVQVRLAKLVAESLGLEIVEATVTGSADVMRAAQSLVGKVDAVYVPTDNTVVAAVQAVIRITDKNKIPVIAGESRVVDKGALGTIGINYRNLGKQTGEMALRVLKGEKPQDMAIESQKVYETVINQDTVDLLGISIPPDIAQKAVMVSTEK
jgi:putative ABC transport system substrate-binding protein